MPRLPLRAGPALDRAGLLPLLAALDRGGVVVVTHHRIGRAGGGPGDPALYSATPEELDRQLRVLASFADVIGPEDLEAAWGAPGRHVLLTFDDGYADARHTALPVLQAHGVRAAFFIATGLIDRPRLPWWDELTWLARRAGVPERAPAWVAVYKRLPTDAAEAFLDALAASFGLERPGPEEAAGEWCTWDDVRALQAAGMELGAHTHDHPLLEQASPERRRAEIRLSVERLAAETGRRPRWFAYPVGRRACVQADTSAELRAQGIALAFTFHGGWHAGRPAMPYGVRRVSLTHDRARLRAQVTAPRVFLGRS